VEWEIDQNSKEEYIKLAKTLNSDKHIQGIIIQHEYGIFGGVDGEKVLHFMEHCKKPMLVTLHTVLPTPSIKMNDVTGKIIKFAKNIVVLTHQSKKIIEDLYPEIQGKIYVIPHGIHPIEFTDPDKFKAKLELEQYTVLSTFGLLSRGKGIEYIINALPGVIKKYPKIIYLILGETHPVIRRNEGEKYRIELLKLIKKLNLQKHVRFYDQYLNLTDLFKFLKATDVYISSSTNPNQAVSGTLSYALGSGRAVVSTEFAQAKEIVTEDTGRLVPIKDSSAITTALLDLLSDKKRLKTMNFNAFQKTRPMLWSNVAKRYVTLLKSTMIPPIRLNHLQTMTDDFGLFQFATFSTPNKKFGYTLDDNARALIFCAALKKQNHSENLDALIEIYLSFIQKCQLPDGSFTNYIDYDDKRATVQNSAEDIEDTQSRALWALSEVLSNTSLDPKTRKKATELFILAVSKNTNLTHLRSIAYTLKSLALAADTLPEYKQKFFVSITEHADTLMKALKQNSIKSWTWYEDHLSYNNAILPESLMIAGTLLKNPEYTKAGLRSLEFLIGKTFTSEYYMPIGHTQWYKNNEKRSEFDQQPEDPASMIQALAYAYSITHKKIYYNLAHKCFGWFLGNNSTTTSLYNEKTAGCYDGLHPDRVNLNQGAESLVSYLMSVVTINNLYENKTN
jgi:glycosyltransferase involved in cell wall biosynthesis